MPATKIALIQQPATRDKQQNVARGLANLEAAARNGAALACYAELAFEWFHPQHPATGDVGALAEPLDGPLVRAFRAKARELGIVAVLNLFEREGGATFDSSPVIDADGSLLGVTRMVHITEYACFHEQGYYTPGDKGAPVYQTRAGRIGVAICDAAGTVATPYETIERSNDPVRDRARIAALVEEVGAEVVVVGHPLGLDGRRLCAQR